MAVTPKSKMKAAQESEKLPDVMTRESRIEIHGYLIRLFSFNKYVGSVSYLRDCCEGFGLYEENGVSPHSSYVRASSSLLDLL